MHICLRACVGALLLLASAAALAADDAAARLSAAVHTGDVSAVRRISADAGFNASAAIVDRAGRRVAPIEAALHALQQHLAMAAARGFQGRSPAAAAQIIPSFLSIISLLAQHATAQLSASCPLRLAAHYRIFPAVLSIIEASADRGLSCILQRDVHGRTLLHVAAASKAAGLSSLLHPDHPVHNASAEHRVANKLLLSALRLRAVPPNPALPLLAHTLPLMNAQLAAHELHIFMQHSSVTSDHLSARDNLGRAALHVAVACAHFDAMTALLGGGADVNAVDVFLRSALHLACSNRLRSIAKYLLDHGADVNARDVDGNAPLHAAAANGDVETFQLLLRYGADSAISNRRNETACARSADARLFQHECGARDDVCAAEGDAQGPESAADLHASGGWGAAMSNPPPLSLHCPFEVVVNISAARFISDFVSLQRPVIIKGLSLLAPAVSLWTKASLRRRWGALDVTVSAVPHARSYGQASSRMPLDMFVQLHMNGSASGGAYVFDSTIMDTEPQLRNDCPPPPLLHNTRIALSQFFIGAAATGSFPHFHGHALNVLVHGRKLWYLFPVGEAHFNVKDIGRWVVEDWPAVAEQRLAVQRAGLAQCVQVPYPTSTSNRLPVTSRMQEAGDAVYVPQHWGHAVYNTAPSVGVAYEFDV